MVSETAAVGAILMLMFVTITVRMSGVWIMSYVRITPRVEAFLRYMATSVLIAIVVPTTFNASQRVWIAVAASAVVMVLTRSALTAMLIGTALAAAGRAFGL